MMRNWSHSAARSVASAPVVVHDEWQIVPALLVDDILPHQAMRQWVLSVPFPLRFLFASNPKAMTLIQRFGSALNLNIHFHMLFLDGVYSSNKHPKWFRRKANEKLSEKLRQPHLIPILQHPAAFAMVPHSSFV